MASENSLLRKRRLFVAGLVFPYGIRACHPFVFDSFERIRTTQPKATSCVKSFGNGSYRIMGRTDRLHKIPQQIRPGQEATHPRWATWPGGGSRAPARCDPGRAPDLGALDQGGQGTVPRRRKLLR